MKQCAQDRACRAAMKSESLMALEISEGFGGDDNGPAA
jgi:hypothetical protein